MNTEIWYGTICTVGSIYLVHYSQNFNKIIEDIYKNHQSCQVYIREKFIESSREDIENKINTLLSKSFFKAKAKGDYRAIIKSYCLIYDEKYQTCLIESEYDFIPSYSILRSVQYPSNIHTLLIHNTITKSECIILCDCELVIKKIKPFNYKRKWTDEEYQQLLIEIKDRTITPRLIASLAIAHQRSYSSIQHKLRPYY
jgi:uncharacterized protein (DUF488 family)